MQNHGKVVQTADQPESASRGDSSRASRYMARAVSLHLSGRAEDALKELQRAATNHA